MLSCIAESRLRFSEVNLELTNSVLCEQVHTQISKKSRIKNLIIEYKNFSATRPCGSKGIGGFDASMKLCLWSSRCEFCLAKGEPARAGSKPCDGVRNGIGDA